MTERVRSQEIVITFSGFTSFVKQHVRSVCKWSGVLGIIALLIALVSPLEYTYEVKIKVPDSKMASPGGFREIIPFFGQSSEVEGAVSLLESHILFRRVVEKMGLQMHCQHRSFFREISDLFKQSFLFGMSKESFFDQDIFRFEEVKFSGEKAVSFFLRCFADGSYEFVDTSGQVLGKALVGSCLESSLGLVTLAQVPRDVVWGKLYSCKLGPLPEAVAYWKQKTRIKMAKFDKMILDFRMVDTDRHRSKEFLHILLLGYQNWKQEEQAKVYEQQISYLRQKAEEITESFRGELAQHRKYLQESLSRYGTLGYTEEIESLMESKNGYKAQLLEIALDLKRVEEIEKEEQKRGLSTLVSNKTEDAGKMGNLYTDIKDPLSSLVVGSEVGARSSQELTKFNSKIIADCLANCIREQERLEEEKAKLSLLLQGMGSPDFEISSLSSVFVDQTVQHFLLKVQDLNLQMKDKDNLSLREQERLQEMMASCRGSLLQQLAQSIQLKQGQIDALQNKILQWRSVWKDVLVSEKRLLQEQLAEITQSMSALPDKWYYETMLETRQEQCQEALKGLEQMRFSVYAMLQPFVYPLQVLEGDFSPTKATTSPFWRQGISGFILAFFGLYFVLFMRSVFTAPKELARHD